MRYLNPELLEALAGSYVLGTLPARPRRRFERLRRQHPPIELAVRRWEQRLLPLAATVPPVQPPAKIWRALDARIDGRTSIGARVRSWIAAFGIVARPVRFALAAQALAIVGLAVALTISRAPEYRTFSAPPSSTVGGHVRIVFSDTATEKEMRAVLRSIGGTVVHGPGEAGLYTIALSDPSTLATALATLQRHPRIRFAAPVAAR